MGRNVRKLQFPGTQTKILLQKRRGRAAMPTKLGMHAHTLNLTSLMPSKCELGRWAPLSAPGSGSDRTGVVRRSPDCTRTMFRGPGAADCRYLGWLMCCWSAGVAWVANACGGRFGSIFGAPRARRWRPRPRATMAPGHNFERPDADLRLQLACMHPQVCDKAWWEQP